MSCSTDHSCCSTAGKEVKEVFTSGGLWQICQVSCSVDYPCCCRAGSKFVAMFVGGGGEGKGIIVNLPGVMQR